MILYVGATGRLGWTVVSELSARGLPVRCLVRQSADTSQLNRSGVELVYGDVRDPASIEKALQGIDTVISSFATNIAKDQKVSSLWETDYEGNKSLIRLSKQQGIKKFIFVSYWGLAKFSSFEHGKIKKLVEDLLSVSGLDYTVFRVTTLATDMSLLLGNSLKKRGRAPMLMKKHEKVRPILLEDLAWCMADSITNPRTSCRIIEVAGEEEYSFIELQELFCRTIKKKIRFIFIPLPLANMIASFTDFATNNKYNAKGLVSAFTGGSTCDITEMKEVFKLKQGSFAKHLEDYFEKGRMVVQKPEAVK
jgi:uncharacterized protein YbjT (DUF2867 family)